MTNIFQELSKAYDAHKPTEEIHELYRKVDDKNVCDTYNGDRSLLHFAAGYGDVGAISILLEAGAKATATNKYDDNPLHALGKLEGCRWHEPSDDDIYQSTQKLYEAKVSVLRKNDNGFTCYHVAAQQANYPMIQALIDAGAKLSGADNNGNTALHLACQDVRHTISSLSYSQRSFDELKPIPEDIQPNWRKIEEERIASATKNLATDKKKLENYFLILKSLVEAGLDPDAKNNYEQDALYYAVESNAKKMAAFLKGEDVNDEQSLIAGGMNLFQAVEKNDPAAVKALVSKGADLNELCTEYKFKDRTPLALACGLVHNECVEILLAGGADPNYRSGEQGRSAMFSLILDSDFVTARRHTYKDVLDILNMLLKAGLNSNGLVDDKSNTALTLCCDNCRNTALIEAIINTPCDVNLANLSGETALMHALKCRDIKRSENIVIMLLENEAKIDTCDKNGNTPLMYAAMNSNHTAGKTVAELLMDFGDVKINAVNNEGKTALDIATKNNNEELVKLLLMKM